jgi:hypothetical protein
MKHMHGPSTSRRLLAGIAVVAALAAGCGGNGNANTGGGFTTSPLPVASNRPSSPAKVTILSPRNGEVVHSSVLHVRLRLQHARIVIPTSTHITPTTGHVHLYLDNKIVSMNYGLDNRIRVTPGTHYLRVEFVASDHLPFDPRVIATAVFEVKK